MFFSAVAADFCDVLPRPEPHQTLLVVLFLRRDEKGDREYPSFGVHSNMDAEVVES